MTKKLLGIGVDAPLILAVFEITALPNQSGKYYPVAYYRDVKGLIPKGLRPAVLVRAAKSNFRLADFFDLAKQGTAEEVRRFIDYAVKEFGQFEKVNEPTVEKYFQFLVAKIIRQKKAMEPLGLRNPNNVWENLATNLTILGEEIDVGDLKPQAWDDGETQTMPLMAMTVKTLTKLGNLINKYHPQKVNLAILPKANKE
jgi:hypothetical protein